MKYEEIENAIRGFKDYENRTGVKTISVWEFIKKGDIAIWIKESSNNQTGFFIVYKVSISSENNWLFWCISQNQIDFLINNLSNLNESMEKLREEKKWINVYFVTNLSKEIKINKFFVILADWLWERTI